MSAGDLAMPTHTLWQQLSRLRREFLLVAACAGLINLLMLAPTLYMLQVFDRVMTSRNMDTLVALSAFTVVLIGLMAFTEWLRARLLVTMSERMDAGLAQPVFQASFDMKRRRADHDGLQPLHDLLQVRQFVTGSGTLALVDAPWVVIYLAALYLMHPVLGAAGAGFCLMLVALSWLTYRWTAGPQAAAGSAKAAAQRMLSSRLPVAETIIALGMLRPMADRWMRVHQEAAAQSDAALRAAQEMQALSRFVQYTQQALILSVGAILAVQGQVTIGAVIAANALLSNALRPVGVLTSAWRPLVDAWAAHGRLKTLLDQPAAANGAPQLPPADGAAEVRGLVARAPATGKEILKGIDLRIAPGEIVAVVGPSGAGKSTLGRCLVGIWRDHDGDILRGGVPLQALDLEVLGKHLGYLPQDGQLFDGSVAENIARLDNVEPGQVVEAARLVGAHDTILSLPLGYDTPLVAGGANLSGGQRQCVALARAFHGRPNLLVLDEPSSNLDDRGERMLRAALAHARSAGAAVVVITHSSQLTAIADRVVTLRDGVVTQIVHQKSPEATA